jgi:hypothetical protein
MTSDQSADPAKCAETGDNADNNMTAMDCIQDEEVILEAKRFSRITDTSPGDTLYRYPHRTLPDNRECDHDAAMRHYYIDVLHGYLFCEHRECWWLQLTFPNKDSCIEHVDEIGTIVLRGDKFKFNCFGSIYDLAGQGEVKMHIFAPVSFTRSIAAPTSSLLNDSIARCALSQTVSPPQFATPLSLPGPLVGAMRAFTTCYQLVLWRNTYWNWHRTA